MNPLKRWVILNKGVAATLIGVGVLGCCVASLFYFQSRPADSAAPDNAKAPAVTATPPVEASAAARAAALKKPCFLEGRDCSIGDIGPGGGTVFFAAASPRRWGQYLEVAPVGWRGMSADPTAPWCESSRQSAVHTGMAIGSGPANTKKMLAACTSGAATMANSYAGGGKTDWYLPSKEEMYALFSQQATLGVSDPGSYWTSSQMGSKEAISQRFTDGARVSTNKLEWMLVRPIRVIRPPAGHQSNPASSTTGEASSPEAPSSPARRTDSADQGAAVATGTDQMVKTALSKLKAQFPGVWAASLDTSTYAPPAALQGTDDGLYRWEWIGGQWERTSEYAIAPGFGEPYMLTSIDLADIDADGVADFVVGAMPGREGTDGTATAVVLRDGRFADFVWEDAYKERTQWAGGVVLENGRLIDISGNEGWGIPAYRFKWSPGNDELVGQAI